MARLARSPFLKLEASKFTEVGYVGRDAESMIRDLTDAYTANGTVTSSGNEFFTGLIDEVAVYNTPLTGAKVREHVVCGTAHVRDVRRHLQRRLSSRRSELRDVHHSDPHVLR